jgi:hypothetical protein
MEVNEKTKDTEFQKNLNFVRKMKYFTQGVMVIIVIIFLLYMRVARLILLLFFYCTGSKGIGAAKKYAIHTVAFYNFENLLIP